jgi:imidazolonepropionase-like amidohydrolase
MNKLTVFLMLVSLVTPQLAQTAVKRTLITNVKIFNGKEDTIINGNILVEGKLIKQITASSIDADSNTLVINGKGKYIIPGLIDNHVHLLYQSIPQNQLMLMDYAFLNLFAAKTAEKELLNGFTTVRDVGGGSLSLARAIDEGLVTGPRVFPSGAFISQTGGHGDTGLPTDVPRKPGDMSYAERNGIVAIADGADQVLMRVREQLRQGATQIKLMAGGGVASNYDPLDVTQYTVEEMKAAVEAAENWGTYVTVHAYTPRAITMAVKAGVKCVEHAQLIDETTIKLMADKNVWISLQPFLDDEDAIPFAEGSINRKKQLETTKGTDNAYLLAKKYKLKIAWGTDCLFDPVLAAKKGKLLSKTTRWFTPFEVLKMATYDNAQLLYLCGKRNPYQEGKLGEVSDGAYADLILVDGNPLENIKLIENPQKNFLVIMKDGVIVKNALNH